MRFEKQQFSYELSEREKEVFENLASTDPLTGAINRRKFDELALRELRRVVRYHHPLTCLMLDIDHFKQINDRYGHAAGDEVLKQFYKTMVEVVRSVDIVARIGGEEFVVLLPETAHEPAVQLAERIRLAVEALQLKLESGEVITLTVSIGVSSWREPMSGVATLLERADGALYRAKGEGRNRVMSAR